MKNCYDWNSNTLSVKDIYGNEFILELKGNKNIVDGKSATGKTLLYDVLKELKDGENKGFKAYNMDNIVLLDKNNRDSLKKFKNTLIIIDRADIVLRDIDVNIINNDFGNNRYLIFSRKNLGIAITPNYYAEMTHKDGVFGLRYEFNVWGWN